MRRILLLLLLAACHRDTTNGPKGPTVVLPGKTYPLDVVHGRKEIEARAENGKAILVVYGHPKFHHYMTEERWDVLFVDDSGTVVEVQKLEGREEGITSGVETSRALFLPPGSGATTGVKLDLPTPEGTEEAVVRLGSHRVFAEISSSLDERTRGLMYRRRLSKDDGMLFVYDHADMRRFWMGNCHIDLDIAFFREDGTLVNVVEMKKYEDPSSDPGDRAHSAEPAMYVLETNLGWFVAHGLTDATGKPLGEVRLEWRK